MQHNKHLKLSLLILNDSIVERFFINHSSLVFNVIIEILIKVEECHKKINSLKGLFPFIFLILNY